MVRPKGFEPPISGIGIRCVIQLRHGRIYCRRICRRNLLYYILFKKSIRKLFPDFILRFLLCLQGFKLGAELQHLFIVACDLVG